MYIHVVAWPVLVHKLILKKYICYCVCVCVYDAVLLMEFVVSILLSSCFWRVNLSKIGVA